MDMINYLFLIASTLLVSGIIQASDVPQFGDIVRNSDGTISYMNQHDAIAYCANLGMHLPSARELAQLSASLGVQGIKELVQFPSVSEANRAGYYRIDARARNTNDGKIAIVFMLMTMGITAQLAI